MAHYWSELPSELLQLISNLSNTSSETRRFRSVCSYWRSSVPSKPSSTTPFHSPTIPNFSSQPHDHFFGLRLVKQTLFLLSLSSDPSSCWLIMTQEHKPGVLTLISPFSKSSLIKSSDFNILDLTNVNTFEVGHEYVLRNINDHDYDQMSLYDNLEHEKVAFCFVGKNYDNFVLLSTHNSTGKLLIYKSYVQEWSFLDDFALGYDDHIGDFVYDWSMRYVDVAEYEGRFYAVTDSGRTIILEYCKDTSSFAVNLMVKSIVGGDKKRLVKSADDDLLLVDLYTLPVDGTIEVNAIDVYKLDKKDKRWVLLKSLEGRSIFLSNYSSFCTNNLSGIRENCIYFCFNNLARDVSEKQKKKERGNDVNNDGEYYGEDGVESNEIGVFEYDKGYFGSMEENFEGSKLFSWPPPSWLRFLRRDL